MSHITNDRFQTFADSILSQTKELIFEREADILAAWKENIEEANTNEKSMPPLKLAIAVSVDLEKNTISTKLSFTASYQSTLVEQIPDPNQLKFEIIDKEAAQ
jgi:hypothetical protein